MDESGSMHAPALIACHECDVLQREVPLEPGAAAVCVRCGATLHRNTPAGLDRSLALLLAAACLFVISNLFPILELDAQGQRNATTLAGAVQALHAEGMTSVAVLVAATTMLLPAVEMCAMLYLLLPLKLGRIPRHMAPVFRVVQAVRPWGMVEVFMLGTLVSLVKLAHLATVTLGVALWSFAGVMALLAAAAASFDPHSFWTRAEALAAPA